MPSAGFVSLKPISRILTIMLWLGVADAVLVFIFDTEWHKVGLSAVSDAIPQFVLNLLPGLELSSYALIFSSFAMYLLWIKRAVQNSKALRALEGDSSPTNWKTLWASSQVRIVTVCWFLMLAGAGAYYGLNCPIHDYLWLLVDPTAAAFCLVSLPLVSRITRDQELAYSKQTVDTTGSKAKPDWVLRSGVAAAVIVYALAWVPFERWLPLELAASDTVFGANSVSSAELANSYGIYLYSHRMYAQAEPLFLRALTIRQTKPGTDSELEVSFNNLAWNCQRQGNYQGSAPYFEKLAAVRDRLYGNKDIRTSYALSQSGNSYTVQNKLSQAEPFYVRALAVAQASKSSMPGDLATCFRNLANCRSGLKHYKQAEDLYEKSIAAGKANGFVDDFQQAEILDSYLHTTMMEPDYKRAEALCHRSLTVCADLGPDHWTVLNTKAYLEAIYQREGKHKAAEELCEQLIKSDEKTHSTDKLAGDLIQLATLYEDEGRLPEAASTYKRSFELQPPLIPAVPGSNAGTMINATLLRKLLAQADKTKVVPEFPFANQYPPDRPTSCRHRAIIDTRPVIYDFRVASTIKLAADKNGSKSEPSNPGTVVAGETIRACIAKLGPEKAVKQFPWCKKFIADGKNLHIKDDFRSTPLTGTNLSMTDLVPSQLLILSSADFKKLQSESGFTDKQISEFNSVSFHNKGNGAVMPIKKSYL